MVRKICLDSDILISLLRKDNPTKELLESLEGNFCISAINYFELWFGRKNSELISELLGWLEVLNLDEESSKIAADILRELKKDGELIDLKDLFIASICIKNEAELLTNNKKHFQRLEKYNLKLIKT